MPDIIPAEDPDNNVIHKYIKFQKHFGRQRLSHVQRNIGLAGWLAGKPAGWLACCFLKLNA